MFEEGKDRVSRSRDDCWRFVRREAGWRVLNDKPEGCEMPSTLHRDPNALPARAELEDALVSAFQCHDGEASDCFIYVEKVTLDSAFCTRIRRSKEGERRVACRVSGEVGYTSQRRPSNFSNLCMRFVRYTDPGVTPASWGQHYDPDEEDKPCEARASGIEITD
jgi:hypothetical protein